MLDRSRFLIVSLVLAWPIALGCHSESSSVDSTHRSAVLRLATTTSARDSGLLDQLLPTFEASAACRVDLIAAGTGAALRLGEAGDVDVVIVHARQLEEAFMSAGHGVRRETFMYNRFVLLGPAADPASIRGLDAIAAMKRIAQTESPFVSRGDQSGTHRRESWLWQQAGGRDDWSQYMESGQGMGPTLLIADEKGAYVLADQGTFLKYRDKVDLVSLAADSDVMQNPYSVISVNPQKHDGIDSQLADRFVDYLIAEPTQRRIDTYQIDGETLFVPLQLKTPSAAPN